METVLTLYAPDGISPLELGFLGPVYFLGPGPAPRSSPAWRSFAVSSPAGPAKDISTFSGNFPTRANALARRRSPWIDPAKTRHARSSPPPGYRVARLVPPARGGTRLRFSFAACTEPQCPLSSLIRAEPRTSRSVSLLFGTSSTRCARSENIYIP